MWHLLHQEHTEKTEKDAVPAVWAPHTRHNISLRFHLNSACCINHRFGPELESVLDSTVGWWRRAGTDSTVWMMAYSATSKTQIWTRRQQELCIKQVRLIWTSILCQKKEQTCITMSKMSWVWLIKYRTEDGWDKLPQKCSVLLAVFVDDMESRGSVWSARRLWAGAWLSSFSTPPCLFWSSLKAGLSPSIWNWGLTSVSHTALTTSYQKHPEFKVLWSGSS